MAPHRLFPGTKLDPSSASTGAFAAANGSPIHNLGNFQVDFWTQEGHARQITFQNANVSFPILSTGRIADNNNTIWYDKDGGEIVDMQTGETSRFVRAMGVYWIQMALTPPSAEGFGRPG